MPWRLEDVKLYPGAMKTIYKYTLPCLLGQMFPGKAALDWLAAYGGGKCDGETTTARIASLTIRRDSITFESLDRFSEPRVRELQDSLRRYGLAGDEAAPSDGDPF